MRIDERLAKIVSVPLLDRIAVHALLVAPASLRDDACADRNDVKFLEQHSLR